MSSPATVETMMDAAVNVLGSMINYPACIPRVLSLVGAEDFVNEAYRAVFQTICRQFQEGRPVDKAIVAERLKLAGNDLSEFVWQLHVLAPTDAMVEEYAAILKSCARVFRLQDIARQMALSRSEEECRAFAAQINQVMIERPGIRETTFAEAYDRFPEMCLEDEAPAMQWPFEALQKAYRFRAGHIGVVGAYPGTGKTAFAMQCAAGFARAGSVGYYTFESSNLQLYGRHVARTALIDTQRIQDNCLTEEDGAEYMALRKQLADLPVTLIEAAGMTAEDVVLHAQARRFACVIVDYVQNVRGNSRGRRYAMSEYEKVTDASQTFQQFAVRTGTAVLLVSQMTRPQKVQRTRKGPDGRQEAYSLTPPPTLSSLRSSGQLEQDADFVLLMWREDEEEADSPRRLQLAKNRHGPSGGWLRLDFDGPHQLFSRMDSRETPPGRPARPTARTDTQDTQGSIFDELDNADLPF